MLTGTLEILFQPTAKTQCMGTHNGVGCGVVVRLSPKDRHPHVLLAESLATALEGGRADIEEKPGELGRADEVRGRKDSLQKLVAGIFLSSFLFVRIHVEILDRCTPRHSYLWVSSA